MKGWSKRWPRNIYQTVSGKYAVRHCDYGRSVYVGSFRTVEKAVAERDNAERVAVKLRRIGYSLSQRRPNYWVLRGPSPKRRMLGVFETRWAAERALDGLDKDFSDA